jgi:predicted RNA-binding Zn-ribbon protein involved in translation (DUF1610 family)
MDAKHSSLECADCGSQLDPARDTAEGRAPCPQCGSIKRAFATIANAQPSNYLLDNYIAHKLSELTQCHAPELKDDAQWLNNFILNSVFRVQLPPKTRAYVFNFLRRTEGASFAYRAALVEIHEYLNTPRSTISPYFRALSHIEICIAQCYQGYELLGSAFGESIYTQGDGSPEERLQIVYVDSKHMDRMIAGEKLPEKATAGVWITNTGIESARGALTFVELHGILCNMHFLAERLSGTWRSA